MIPARPNSQNEHYSPWYSCPWQRGIYFLFTNSIIINIICSFRSLSAFNFSSSSLSLRSLSASSFSRSSLSMSSLSFRASRSASLSAALSLAFSRTASATVVVPTLRRLVGVVSSSSENGRKISGIFYASTSFILF